MPLLSAAGAPACGVGATRTADFRCSGLGSLRGSLRDLRHDIARLRTRANRSRSVSFLVFFLDVLVSVSSFVCSGCSVDFAPVSAGSAPVMMILGVAGVEPPDASTSSTGVASLARSPDFEINFAGFGGSSVSIELPLAVLFLLLRPDDGNLDGDGVGVGAAEDCSSSEANKPPCGTVKDPRDDPMGERGPVAVTGSTDDTKFITTAIVRDRDTTALDATE